MRNLSGEEVLQQAYDILVSELEENEKNRSKLDYAWKNWNVSELQQLGCYDEDLNNEYDTIIQELNDVSSEDREDLEDVLQEVRDHIKNNLRFCEERMRDKSEKLKKQLEMLRRII